MEPRMNHWMIAISEENLEATRRLRFQSQGFTIHQRRKVVRMEPGDRLLHYTKENRAFVATSTITSKSYEDDSPIWSNINPQENYVHRVKIRGSVILPAKERMPAVDIAPRLEYLKRWPPERWPLAFEGELHLLPKTDFQLIEGEMKKHSPGSGLRKQKQ